MRNFRKGIFGLSLLLSASGVWAGFDGPRQAELLYLLKHDCGSCHGMRLEGGLGPPLRPDRLRPWGVDQLATVILYGRPGTPMPPWRPFMTDQEARWLAESLKRGVRP